MTRKYSFLTVSKDKQVERFLTQGWIKIEGAFSPEKAADVSKDVWRRLDMDPNDQSTWSGEWINMPDLNTEAISTFAPAAWGAMGELLGGTDRIHPDARFWNDAFIVNVGSPDIPYGEPPKPFELNRWHFDGDSFLHFLDSPEQGLLVVPIFTEILPSGGGTLIAPQAIDIIARRLAAHPEGLWLKDINFPEIRDQCTQFVELTGKPGDVVLLHPFMLHTATRNSLRIPRIITNPPVWLSEPFCYSRSNPDDYSLVELKTIKALGGDPLKEGYSFTPTAKRRMIVTEREKRQNKEKIEQQQRLNGTAVTA